jgi:hypothetical protein
MPHSVFSKKDESILKILKSLELSVDTDIVCVSVSKNITSMKAFKELVSHLSDPTDVLISSVGKTAITILLHEKFLQKAKSIFGKDIQDINIKVGAIFLKCPAEVNITPGITAFISSLFADKNITIYELIVTYTDYVIVVNEKEAYKMASFIQRILED